MPCCGNSPTELRRVAPYYYGDYYPLTPYSLSEDAWIAWQFHRPETEEGLVEAFRRPRSQKASISLKLRGLDPQAVYEIKNADLEEPTRASGRDLMEKGLPGERCPPSPGRRDHVPAACTAWPPSSRPRKPSARSSNRSPSRRPDRIVQTARLPPAAGTSAMARPPTARRWTMPTRRREPTRSSSP